MFSKGVQISVKFLKVCIINDCQSVLLFPARSDCRRVGEICQGSCSHIPALGSNGYFTFWSDSTLQSKAALSGKTTGHGVVCRSFSQCWQVFRFPIQVFGVFFVIVVVVFSTLPSFDSSWHNNRLEASRSASRILIAIRIVFNEVTPTSAERDCFDYITMIINN